MAKIVKKRRGTTVEHSTFTGAIGELTVNTDLDTVVVHDGVTVGGFSLARSDGSNLTGSSAGSIGLAELNISGAAGTAGQVLSTDGSGNLSFGAINVTGATTGFAVAMSIALG